MSLLTLLRSMSSGGSPVVTPETSFLICHPDLPKRALTVTSTFDDENFPVSNTFYGERHAWAVSGAGTDAIIYYDLGSGNTSAVDHFILGGAQRLRALGVTWVTLSGSNDNISYTPLLGTLADFQSCTFDGPDGDDVIFTVDYNDTIGTYAGASYRYFEVYMNGGGGHLWPISKIYFGQALDLGKEPDNYDVDIPVERASDTWQYPRGHVLMTRSFDGKYRFTVEWDGLTDAKAQELCEKLLSNPYRDRVFLFTGTHEDPLYDNMLVHCKVLDGECSLEKSNLKVDWWTLICVFEQL